VATGKLIVLEGPDGSGKSTQAALLVRALEGKGAAVTHLRDPGGTEVGDRIRDLLLRGLAMDATTELFLFLASRARLVAEKIRPALEAGRVVICERFTMSTVVYQVLAADRRPAGVEDGLRAAVALSALGLVPDVVIVLDVDPGTGLGRKEGPAGLDRIERRGPEFQRRVREGYLAEARRDPRAVPIPPGTPEETHRRVLAEAERVLAAR
jgi:dTMP kinase